MGGDRALERIAAALERIAAALEKKSLSVPPHVLKGTLFEEEGVEASLELLVKEDR